MLFNKQVAVHFIAFVIFIIASIYITFPLIFHLGDYVTGYGDELLIAWIQNWIIHSLTTGNIFGLFNANIYFPYHNTLAYSDLHFISALLASIPLGIIKEPITVVNFTFISSLIFLGFFLYWASFYLTKSFFVSLLSGLLIIFSPAVLSYYVHLQMLAVEWVPLSILCLIIFVNSAKSRFLGLSLSFFLIQAYNSFLPGYFIIFSYIIIILFAFVYRRKQLAKLVSRKHIFFIAATFLLLIPITIPYFQVSREFNYARDIRDSIHFALEPEDLLYSSGFSRLSPSLNSLPFNKTSQNNEFKPGFLGLIFTLLSLFSIAYVVRKGKQNNIYTLIFITTASIGLVVSLGPVLHVARQTVHKPFPVPLPYALFYYVLPGFQGFRNSARWEMLFILCMAVLIALVLDKFLRKYSFRNQIIVYTVLIIGTIAEFSFPMRYYLMPHELQAPKVYSWLNTTPKSSAVIFLPIYNWNSPYAGEELKREYFSTLNFRRTVNGYSGFSPPPWQKLIIKLHENFPQQAGIKMLKDLHVNYIIIDKNQYDKAFAAGQEKHNGISVINSLRENSSLKFTEKVEDMYVFKLQ